MTEKRGKSKKCKKTEKKKVVRDGAIREKLLMWREPKVRLFKKD
jgi:hypothetical protein